MKQFSLVTLPLLCAAIAPLSADNADHLISQNGNNSQAANQRMNSQKQMDQRLKDNAITPMAHPRPDGSWNPYITADFIYWKAYEDGLAYAYDGVPGAPTAVPPSATSGKVFRPDFEWEPGFKIGFGNKFMHDGWDLYAQYTWLNSDADDDESDEDDCCVTTTVTAESNYWLKTVAGPEDVLVGEEGSRWNLNSFNVLDLELGRGFYISKYLTMRPFGGLKFSWQHQKYRVKYSDVLAVSDASDTPASTGTIPVGSNVKVNFKQREFGVGLRFGMNSEWYFNDYLGVYGDFALTGLWNHFKPSREVEINTPAGTEYDSEVIKDKVYNVTAVLEFGLGLFFEWAWHNDEYVFNLSAGWEDQIWFNQNNFTYLMNNNAPGNLSFKGFTLKAGFSW